MHKGLVKYIYTVIHWAYLLHKVEQSESCTRRAKAFVCVIFQFPYVFPSKNFTLEMNWTKVWKKIYGRCGYS